MRAYNIYDHIEEQNQVRYYKQLAREERESELADELEKGLPLRLVESLCIDELQRRGACKQAIHHAFDHNVEFQERAAGFMRYTAETIARHQVDIESEGLKL